MFETSYEFEVEGGHDVLDAHRHRYRIRIECAGELQQSGPARGMVVDFRRLAGLAREVVRRELEGKMLVERSSSPNRSSSQGLPMVEVDFRPTVELLAKHCFDQLVSALDPSDAAAVRRVEIWENPHCMAAYAPDCLPAGVGAGAGVGPSAGRGA